MQSIVKRYVDRDNPQLSLRNYIELSISMGMYIAVPIDMLKPNMGNMVVAGRVPANQLQKRASRSCLEFTAITTAVMHS